MPQRAAKPKPRQCPQHSVREGRAPVLFLGSAPAPGDLCQVISLLCAGVSSCAARGCPGGMIPLHPARSRCPWSPRLEERVCPSPCPILRGEVGKPLPSAGTVIPPAPGGFNDFSFQGWSGTEPPVCSGRGCQWSVTPLITVPSLAVQIPALVTGLACQGGAPA